MKNFAILFLFLVVACNQKPKDKVPKAEPFFPVLSYIKSQVAQVDTSLYSIIKVRWTDSTHTDTTYIKREEFRGLAKDFLELPDISDKKYKDLYTEEKFFDAGINKVILTYLPTSDTTTIKRQEVLINKEAEGDKVSNFIINTQTTNRDSSVEKRLLWEIDQSFNVISTVQKPGQPELTRRFKVVWE